MERKLPAQADDSRALFEAAAETADLSVWEYDIPARTIRLFGSPLAQPRTRLFTGGGVLRDISAELALFLDEEGAERCLGMFRAIENGAPSASCECWYRQQPGQSPRCERLSCTAVFGENGKPARAFGAGQDITAQKLADRRYDNLCRQLLQVNPFSLGAFRLNLTANLCFGGQSAYPAVLSLQEHGTADDFLRSCAANIADERIRQTYLARFTCENLLAEFRCGRTEISVEYPAAGSTGATVWVGGYISMAQNPANGNVEAVVYAINITEQKIEEHLFARIAEDNFDHIGLILPAARTFELRKQNRQFPAVFLNEPVDYDTLIRRVSQNVLPEDLEQVRSLSALDALTAALYEKNSFSFTFRTYGPDGSVRRKKVQYCWLDSTKSEILVMQSDVTEVYELEQSRHRREAAAEQAAQQLRSLETTLDSIPAGLAVYERKNGRTVTLIINEFLCRLVHSTRAEILNGDFDGIVHAGVHPDDVAYTLASMERLFSGGSASFTYRTRLSDTGEYLWISAVGRAIADENGALRAYVLYRDATEQKLREAEFDRKIRELSAVNPNTVALFHLNLSRDRLLQGQVFWPCGEALASEATADGLFARAGELLKSAQDRVRFSARISREALLAAYGRGELTQTVELRLPHGDPRELRWVTIYVTLAKNPRTGDVEAVLCVLDTHEAILSRDIIARISGEDYDFFSVLDVRRRTTHFLSIQDCERETVPVATGVYDEDIRHAASVFNLPEEREELLRRLSFDTILRELEAHGVYFCAYSLHLPDGRVLRKQMKYVWLDSSHETILSTRVDITAAYQQEQAQLKKMETALHAAESANEAKTEFLSRISHDIRTPISIISSMTRFAYEDLDDRARLTDDLGKIETSNKFLLSLINDVLDISKIDSGKIELNPEPYRYEEFLANIRNMLEPLCARKGLAFSLDSASNVPALLADKVRLNQIAFNLLSNAVKYTPSGGRIAFRTFGGPPENGRVPCGFTVADTGIGMSEEFQKQMFEPFTQEFTNPNHPKAETGTGLGLSIVRRLTELMGGRIEVKSALGRGTEITVRFRFPEASAEPAAPAPPEPERPLSGRVLVAEDNAINAEIASRLLASFGLEADCEENGQKALDRFLASAPGAYRAVLLDLQMPVLNGYETAAAIRASRHPDHASIPILAVTADAFTAAQEKCLAAGMNGYITKPLDPQKLRVELQALLH
jgi:signal transduction histidine kinase/PAS domain-containing protein